MIRYPDAEGSMSGRREPGELYDTDIVEWSDRQSALLARRAAGELVNDGDLDWANIAEEIQDVGRSAVAAVRSQLKHALLHWLKVEAWPHSESVPHWRAELRAARGNAADEFLPSMRQKLDLDAIYRRALQAMPESIDGQPGRPVPPVCPFTLDQLLAEE
jgi:hypothetical protein